MQCPRPAFGFGGQNRVFLRTGDDRFAATPAFRDSLNILSGGEGNNQLVGGSGPDGISGGDGIAGAGTDTLRGGDGNDSIFGAGGEDTLFGDGGDDDVKGGIGDDTLDGGAGNDRVVGGNDKDRILGGEGNDNLIGFTQAVDPTESETRAAVDDLVGGPGVDQFVGGGGDRLFARDGIKETSLGCFNKLSRSAANSGGFAEVDLQDEFVGKTRTCQTVSRAPVNETPSATIKSSTVKVRGAMARVSVRCTTSSTCRGKLSLKLDRKGARKVSVSYTVKGKKTKKLSLRLSAKDAKGVTSKGVNALATVREKGKSGPRSVNRVVKAKR